MSSASEIVNVQELGAGDIRDRIAAASATVLIPMGSCERHGNPYTPIGLDGLVSLAVVERAARAAEVLHTPLMPFGYAPEHFGEAGGGCGNISFRSETYRLIMRDIGRCLVYQGFDRLVFVSLHSSNSVVSEEVLFELRHKTGALAAFYGGRENIEAQRVLDSSPDRLSSDVEAAFGMALMEERFNNEGYLSHGYRVHSPKWLGPAFSKQAGTGITVEFQGARNISFGMEDSEYVTPLDHGDPRPSDATPEKGRIILDQLAAHLAAFAGELKKTPVEVRSRDYRDRVR